LLRHCIESLPLFRCTNKGELLQGADDSTASFFFVSNIDIDLNTVSGETIRNGQSMITN
jgi:hypothetical protein